VTVGRQRVGVFLVALGLFGVLAGALAGLWLAMTGWFLLSAGAAERAKSQDERLRGRTVRDVMTCPPASAPSW
jgi:hypothetical protein